MSKNKIINQPDETAALFDFDRTVIDVNSALLFAKHEYRNGTISTWQFFTSIYYGVLYHFDFIDIEKAYSEALQLYKGRLANVLEELTRIWFEQEVKKHVQPGALKALEWHRQRGDPLVLVTNSTGFMAKVISETWEFDHWIANNLPVDDEGRITGELDLPLCYGEGKVVRSKKWAEKNGINLNKSYFYTDSITDLPLLEAVGYPRIVNPDPKLRHLAGKRKWPILDWTIYGRRRNFDLEKQLPFTDKL
ncbi:MAG: HAD-IB family hydrolase [Deltaproteobacteria bacterium]|jgi:HAD superfamily hydrolase (TIGR01490 family)|nr:HAD-IB family hydrolase [Deltaproteobacteria bacterium]